MSELELQQRAQSYMLSLANGMDPFSGEEIENDSVINNVRMSRCFFYVADVLKKVIDNGGEVGKVQSKPKREFAYLPQEIIDSFPYSDDGMGINSIVRTLREAMGENTKVLSAVRIADWLVAEGYLIENIRSGKREKVPTPNGTALGIRIKEGTNLQSGIPYRMNIYNAKAQRFILENYNRILALREENE